MAVDPTLVGIFLQDRTVREIFEAIAKNRQVVFRDLLMFTSRDRDAVRRSLDTLQRANLVKGVDESTKVLGDFGRYYVTADGLQIERQLESMGL